MTRAWNGSFGGSSRCRRAQALVNSLLGAKAPQVFYYGNRFTHFADWSDRALVHMAAKWAAKNKGLVPGEAEVQAWCRALQARTPTPNAIVLGVFPPESTPLLEAALDGSALHEAFHGLYSCQRLLEPSEIRELIVKNWARLDWTVFEDFLLEAHNAFEDVRCERRGIREMPGTQAALEALADYCLRVPKESKKTSAPRVRNLLMGLGILGHTVSTVQTSLYLGGLREQDPDLMRDIEEGKYRPILDELREIDLDDDLAAMRLAIKLAAQLAQEGFGKQIRSPADACRACGAPREKLRGILLPRQDRTDPTRTLVILCEACGHQEVAEVIPETCAGGAAGGQAGLSVIDLEAAQDAKQQDGGGLAAQGTRTSPGTYIGVEQAMEAAAERAWGQQIAQAARDGNKGAPYRPFNPGGDEVVVLPRKDHLFAEAQKMRVEVDQQVCAIRAGLRRMVRSVQPTTTREVSDGIDLNEDRLAETAASLALNQVPDRAFLVESQRIDPRAAAVFVIDLSTSMRGWVRDAGKVMLAGACAFEDVRFASACIGFQDGTGDLVVEASRSSGCHRTGAVKIVIFKFFHERVGPNLTRFAQVRAGGSTPMADGIQAGIEALLSRSEALRMLFLISDGDPNCGTEDTIRCQIQQGIARGLTFCGLGIGPGAQKILELVPDSIHAASIQEVPQLLLARMATLVKRQIRRESA